MYCKTCGYLAHEGCCEGCTGHTTDGYCVTEDLLQAGYRLSLWAMKSSRA
jgi:hypothetical protein